MPLTPVRAAGFSLRALIAVVQGRAEHPAPSLRIAPPFPHNSVSLGRPIETACTGLKKEGVGRNICSALNKVTAHVHSPSSGSVEHGLAAFLPALNGFESTRELESSPKYATLRKEIEEVLSRVVQEDLAPADPPSRSFVRATAWNIERGLKLEGLLSIFREHPVVRESDILLLTELDWGMARTNNRFVAREIASALGLNFGFSTCYIALNKGSGLETSMPGENTQALHGNALFSRFPLSEVHSIALPNGKDLMKGKEKRLGCQRAVVATIHHPSGDFRAVSLHLDAHSSQKHRRHQMKVVLDHLQTLRPLLPVLIGGDWNTSTYDSRRALYSILGYARRVLMGIRHVIEDHYPHPDRWFERHLFRELERQGYRYRDLNQPGACTLHYSVDDLAANHRMADWIPNWCFWFIRWALQRNGGRCSMKLDWFAGKEISAHPNQPPQVVKDTHRRGELLSDHDPIVLDFRLTRP